MPKVPSKKTARKTAKAPTSEKTAVKKTAAKKTAVNKTAQKKTVTNKAVASKTAVKKTAAKKTARKTISKSPVIKREPIVTTVIAKIDAGFGNEVYIRGNNSGLTWDAGVLMENTGTDEWVWKSTSVTSELEFKVLVNDETWSVGANGVVFPGATVVFEPVFE